MRGHPGPRSAPLAQQQSNSSFFIKNLSGIKTWHLLSALSHRPKGPPGAPIAVADLPEAAQERIRCYQAAAQASITSTAYGAQLRPFKAWCELHGFSDAPPVSPAIVAARLTERASGVSIRSTIAVALAAIRVSEVHRAAEFVGNEVADHGCAVPLPDRNYGRWQIPRHNKQQEVPRRKYKCCTGLAI
jgi:hypothetical protein